MKIKKIDGKSRNPQNELQGLLKKNFPEIFAEGKVDCQKLKRTLGEDVEANGERYGLSWAGKGDCFRHIQEPTTKTLKPAKDESVDFENTGNLFIEGENLEVLKVLQKSYYGKIKAIYIDPPYNTGNDSFIYPDRFQESQDEYLRRIGDKDEEGNLTKEGMFRKNSKDSGHYHSNWLSMMYPRLFLARNLLRQDGVIFVSIDDNEVHNLRMIMNEIFGEENFIGQIIIKSNPRGSQEPLGISAEHEYVLCYSRTEEGKLSITGNERKEDDDEFSYTSDDGRKARLLGLRKRGGDWRRSDRLKMYYPFYIDPKSKNVSLAKTKNFSIAVFPVRPEGEESRWTWGSETAKNRLNELIAREVKRNGDVVYDIYRIDYLEKENGERKTEKVKSIWEDKELNYQFARQYFKEFFGSSEIFDFPKSPHLISKLISSLNDKDGITLDFFSGSGTTAHAIMAQNSEDGGNRKYICVQLAETCDEKSEAFKAGFKTIADIAKERIRRAGTKIKKENGSKLNFENKKLDSGFKVFKLDDSNFKVWNGNVKDPEELEKQMLEFVDNVRKESTAENMLYELLLKSGLDPNVSVEKKKANGGGYYSVDEGKLIVHLEGKISKELVEAILKAKPEKMICLDRAFGGNDQLKTNTALSMESAKIDFRVV